MAAPRHRWLKYCAYALIATAAFVMQSTRGFSVTLWGSRLDALPMVVAAVALFEGPYGGGALGFYAGLLIAVHSPMVEGLSALYLGLFGIAFGLLGSGWLRRVCPAALLGGLSCIALQGALRYVFYSRLVYDLSPREALWPLAAELLLAVIPGILCFYIIRAVHRQFIVD